MRRSDDGAAEGGWVGVAGEGLADGGDVLEGEGESSDGVTGEEMFWRRMKVEVSSRFDQIDLKGEGRTDEMKLLLDQDPDAERVLDGAAHRVEHLLIDDPVGCVASASTAIHRVTAKQGPLLLVPWRDGNADGRADGRRGRVATSVPREGRMTARAGRRWVRTQAAVDGMVRVMAGGLDPRRESVALREGRRVVRDAARSRGWIWRRGRRRERVPESRPERDRMRMGPVGGGAGRLGERNRGRGQMSRIGGGPWCRGGHRRDLSADLDVLGGERASVPTRLGSSGLRGRSRRRHRRRRGRQDRCAGGGRGRGAHDGLGRERLSRVRPSEHR